MDYLPRTGYADGNPLFQAHVLEFFMCRTGMSLWDAIHDGYAPLPDSDARCRGVCSIWRAAPESECIPSSVGTVDMVLCAGACYLVRPHPSPDRLYLLPVLIDRSWELYPLCYNRKRPRRNRASAKKTRHAGLGYMCNAHPYCTRIGYLTSKLDAILSVYTTPLDEVHILRPIWLFENSRKRELLSMANLHAVFL